MVPARAYAPRPFDVRMAELYAASFAEFVGRRARVVSTTTNSHPVLLAALKEPPRAAPTVALPAMPQAAQGGARPYKCRIAGCTSLFGKANHLSRHIRIVHNKERPFRCEEAQCGSRFGSRSHLVDHVNAVHKRLRNFRCERCNAAFSKSFNLAKHKRLMHTKVAKTHRCLHCELSFGTRSHLTRHATKVHATPRRSDAPSDQSPPRSPALHESDTADE